MVEERREKLQGYLRFIVELCSRPNIRRKNSSVTGAILKHGMTKEQFLYIFPFFK